MSGELRAVSSWARQVHCPNCGADAGTPCRGPLASVSCWARVRYATRGGGK